MYEVNLWFCLQEAGDDWEFAGDGVLWSADQLDPETIRL
jgi:hypothetical protein